MGMGCIIHVMDYTCCVSVKRSTCIDMGDYLRERLYLEGVRRRTPPPETDQTRFGRSQRRSDGHLRGCDRYPHVLVECPGLSCTGDRCCQTIVIG